MTVTGGNKRTGWRITYEGRTLTVAQWARDMGVTPILHAQPCNRSVSH
jgi:hypothetical protein